MEYMNKPWIDIRLNQKVMDFLWDAISEENKESFSKELAGNISKSEHLKDKDNWFYEKVLKKHTEKMFYQNWDNFSKYHIEEERPFPEFGLKNLWVNYMKQHEFNPIHKHGGLFSFVIFMKIPTHWKEQHALSISANSNAPNASNFAFIWSQKDSVMCENTNFKLSPEDEGRMLFFPSWLSHLVYPFYECEEKRVTISGNINSYVPINSNTYEEKENMLKMMKNSVQEVEEELKWMKKESEKEGSN